MSTFVDFSGRFLLPVLFAELCKKSVESRKNRVNKEFTSYRCSFIVVKTLSLSRFCRDLAIFWHIQQKSGTRNKNHPEKWTCENSINPLLVSALIV